MNYADFHRTSIEDPENFWRKEAERIDWHVPFSQVLDYSRPPFANWFVGGQTNLCHNAVDRWASRQGEQTALIAITTETPDGAPAEKPGASKNYRLKSSAWRRSCNRWV